MNERLNTNSTGQRSESLSDSRLSHRLRTPARFWIIALFLIGVMSPPPPATLAQQKGGTSAQGGGSGTAEGATISANQIKLKPGYRFERRRNGTYAVRRMRNNGITVEAECVCTQKGDSSNCDVSTAGKDSITCTPNGCSKCVFKSVIISRAGVNSRQ